MTTASRILFLVLSLASFALVTAQPANPRQIQSLEVLVKKLEGSEEAALSDLREQYRRLEERLDRVASAGEQAKLVADVVRVLEDPFAAAAAEKDGRSSAKRRAFERLRKAIPTAMEGIELEPLRELSGVVAKRIDAVLAESSNLDAVVSLGLEPLAQRAVQPLLDSNRSFHVRWNEYFFAAHPAALKFAEVSGSREKAVQDLAIARDPVLAFQVGAPEGFARVPAGEYLMANTAGFAGSGARKKPLVKVRVENDVFIGLFEVRVGEYLAWLKTLGAKDRALHRPKTKKGGELWNYDEDQGEPWPTQAELEHPVRGILLTSAVLYAKSVGARLPTEIEWCAMAGGTAKKRELTLYPWGAKFLPGHCNCLEEEPSGLKPVGSYPRGRGPFGHFDVVGNVAEWTLTYENAKPIDANDIADAAAVVRGASFKQGGEDAVIGWVWFRRALFERDEATGFRLARDAN